MQLRDAKRLWRYRQAAIERQIRILEHSPEWDPRNGLLRRIVEGYRRERDRYHHLVHAQDRFSGGCPG